MGIESTRSLPDLSELVAGLFTDVRNAKDAICDLSQAGFDASQINVAYPSESAGHVSVATAEHTIPWKLKDSFERDLYEHGSDQLAGATGGGRAQQNSPFTDVDLRQALSDIGVAPDRILLIEAEVGAGVLLLVKCGDRSLEAEEILERNSGTIRTSTALEAAPKVPVL